MSLALDNYIAKKRGLSYGQYMALTDEKERERLRKQYKKEFDQEHLRAKKKR